MFFLPDNYFLQKKWKQNSAKPYTHTEWANYFLMHKYKGVGIQMITTGSGVKLARIFPTMLDVIAIKNDKLNDQSLV